MRVPPPRADRVRAFDVLEACADARCVPDFKEDLVAALHEHFGVRHISFFAGPTHHSLFNDPRPLTAGDTARMLPEYRDRWFRHDVFGTPAATRQLVLTGVSSLDELQGPARLPAAAEAYVRHFLVGTWRMSAAAALRLELPGGGGALIGLFDAGDRLGPVELATLRLLSGPLSAIARNLPPSRSAGAALARLGARQREVALLVGDGLANAEIAEALDLAEDSVKKYVSRALAATGCLSRMELALLVRARG